MKAFLVGLLVLFLAGVFSILGILLFPLLLVLGFFLRFILMIVLVLFAVWLVGKLTLLLIDYLAKKK